jgi:hypothetical protein
MIIRKYIYTLLKRGKIKEFHSKLTIVNAKDSLCTMVQNFRPIVEFPGEALGYRYPHLYVQNLYIVSTSSYMALHTPCTWHKAAHLC